MKVRLDDSEELLLRQIRPDHMLDDGVPSSQAFKPMPKDDNRLSLDRSSKITPQQSFEDFRKREGKTVAVFGLTVCEFNIYGIECYDDPVCHNSAHSYADFSTLPSKSQHRKVSQRLKRKAIVRGQLYPLM